MSKTIRINWYFSPKMPVFHVFQSKNSKINTKIVQRYKSCKLLYIKQLNQHLTKIQELQQK